MKTLLQYKQKEVESKAKGFTSVNEQIFKAELTIKTNKAALKSLMKILERSLQEIIDNDPDVKLVNVDTLIGDLRKYTDRLLAGDKTILEEEELSLPGASGLDAAESRDDLYRERFESLPPRFDTNLQSVD